MDEVKLEEVQDSLSPLGQQSPTFLAPGTNFVEDNFSTGWGGDGSGMIQADYICCALNF